MIFMAQGLLTYSFAILKKRSKKPIALNQINFTAFQVHLLIIFYCFPPLF